MKVTRDIIVVIADTHFGSTLSICPETQLDDGGSYTPSKAQLWLMEKWVNFWEYANNWKSKGGGKRYFILNGDSCDTPGMHNSTQFISSNPADIHKLAINTLESQISNFDYRFMTRGTFVHVGAEAHLTESIACDLECEQDIETGTYSWWELPLQVQGHTWVFAHHGSLGQRSWTFTNGANTVAAETIFEYLNHNQPPPDYVIRSHMHRYADSYNNYRVRAIFTPAWQLRTGYTQRIAVGKLATIGGIIFIIENGEVQVLVKQYVAPRRNPWVAPN